jgi:hypothetical protein
MQDTDWDASLCPRRNAALPLAVISLEPGLGFSAKILRKKTYRYILWGKILKFAQMLPIEAVT